MSIDVGAILGLVVIVSLVGPVVDGDRGSAADSTSPEGDRGTAIASPVDSIVPMEVAIERFQAGIPNPEVLRNGEPSRDQLIARFVASLVSSDTTALVRMVLDRAEFAWLYYPTTRETLPPYELPPDLAWFRVEQVNARGLGRALRELGGHEDLRLVAYECAPEPVVEADNTIWTGCLTTITYGGSNRVKASLFGAILERGGRFKFISYSNDF